MATACRSPTCFRPFSRGLAPPPLAFLGKPHNPTSRRPRASLVAHARQVQWRSRGSLHCVAFQDTELLRSGDWRLQRMTEVSRSYFGALWSHGNTKTADSILADDVIYRDNMFYGPGLLVGRSRVKELVSEAKSQYPDLYFEMDEIAYQDHSHVWVMWRGHGTQLDSTRAAEPASYHNSIYSGVTILGFSSDRTHITEISVFRQPTAEERRRVESSGCVHPLELRLARLHWEAPETPSAMRSGDGGSSSSGGGGSGQSGRANGNGGRTGNGKGRPPMPEHREPVGPAGGHLND